MSIWTPSVKDAKGIYVMKDGALKEVSSAYIKQNNEIVKVYGKEEKSYKDNVFEIANFQKLYSSLEKSMNYATSNLYTRNNSSIYIYLDNVKKIEMISKVHGYRGISYPGNLSAIKTDSTWSEIPVHSDMMGGNEDGSGSQIKAYDLKLTSSKQVDQFVKDNDFINKGYYDKSAFDYDTVGFCISNTYNGTQTWAMLGMRITVDENDVRLKLSMDFQGESFTYSGSDDRYASHNRLGVYNGSDFLNLNLKFVNYYISNVSPKYDGYSDIGISLMNESSTGRVLATDNLSNQTKKSSSGTIDKTIDMKGYSANGFSIGVSPRFGSSVNSSYSNASIDIEITAV